LPVPSALVVRLYRPRAAILNGEWMFPTAVVAE
jgi:hypothetical protein